jgi:hypothetical protein
MCHLATSGRFSIARTATATTIRNCAYIEGQIVEHGLHPFSTMVRRLRHFVRSTARPGLVTALASGQTSSAGTLAVEVHTAAVANVLTASRIVVPKLKKHSTRKVTSV